MQAVADVLLCICTFTGNATVAHAAWCSQTALSKHAAALKADEARNETILEHG